MRMVNVYVMKGDKQVKRYTEWFTGPSDVPVHQRKTVAVKLVKEKFGRCFPGCNFVAGRYNQ
jgi:hypothetical protein